MDPKYERPGRPLTGWIDDLNDGLEAFMYTMHQMEKIYKKAERLTPVFKDLADILRPQDVARSAEPAPPDMRRRTSAGVASRRRKSRRNK